MNYAQDRLDRRELLLSVIQKHLRDEDTKDHDSARPDADATIDHTKYGQICMMLGWNIHALYHYGRAWYEQPTNCYKLGDYVQMMEIYGYPEIALLTIFVYRSLTTQSPSADHKTNNNNNSTCSHDDDDEVIRKLLIHPPWLDDDDDHTDAPHTVDSGDIQHPCTFYNGKHRYDSSAEEMIGKHCGCHDRWCGRYSNQNRSPIVPCWIPMSRTSMNHVLTQLRVYCQNSVLLQYQYQQRNVNDNTNVRPFTTPLPPTAHELLGEWTEALQSHMTTFMAASEHRIPKLLRFWCHDTWSTSSDTATTTAPQYRTLVPVVQLLCIKLLYLVIPSLAIEAIIHIRYQQQSHLVGPDRMTTHHDWDTLASQYKSHWAYYIFIEALVFGERIKPSRRRQMRYQHIAWWDRLWGMNDMENGSTKVDSLTKFKSDNNHASAPQYNSACNEKIKVNHVHLINNFIDKLQQLLDDMYPPDCHNIHDSKATGTSLSSPVQLQPIALEYPQSSVLPQNRPIFLLGDSHVLSLAWHTIHIPQSRCDTHPLNTVPYLIVPIVITGLKAWHIRSETRFFTNTCLQTMLRRIPPDVQTVIVSAGEIDCREGMGGPLLQGYTHECYDHVKATVTAYILSLLQIIQSPSNSISQILITPVAPHIERNKGRVVGHASRRETIRVWNDELRCQLVQHNRNMYLLDYIDQIQVPIKKSNGNGQNSTRMASEASNVYALNPIFNADSTHMNGAFAPIVQEAIIRCQCDLSKL